MKTVMVVDDSSSIRKSVTFVLKRLEYNIIEAETGVDALQKLKENQIDLIICDVNMPEMDGLTFIKTYKNEPEYEDKKFVPVIMLTTENQQDKISEGKALGVRAWMIKPFPADEIIDAVKKFIG